MSLGSRLINFGWLTVGIAALIVVIVMGMALKSQQAAEQWVTHTLEVQGVLRTVEGDSYALAGRTRGYVLGHGRTWLDGYQALMENARAAVARVQQLTPDNPAQQASIAPLRAAVNAEIGWSQHIIDLVQQSGFAAAAGEISSGKGEDDLSRTAQIVDGMLAEESRLLAIRVGTAARLRRIGYLLAVLLAVMTAAQLGISAAFLRSRFRDLERQRAELLHARNYAESIVATVREPLLVLDSSLRVASANRSFYQTFKTEPAATEGSAFTALGGGSWNIPELLDRLHHVMEGREEMQHFPLEHDFGTAGRRHLLLSARKVYRPGNHSGQILLAIEDDTERRRAEMRLRLVNAELEGFAYSVAHDLRAPLRGMQGFSEALIEDYAEKLGPAGVGYAKHIGSAAKRMDELIRDLLDYSRLTRTEIVLEKVAIGQAVAAARMQVEGVLQAANAELVVNEPLPTVQAHFATLVQVLANLLSNAAKFVPPGATPRLAVRAEPRHGKVRLWVEDNGIGIAPQFHDRIFRVFERLHGQEAYPGTGIGLAIVRKGMERMNGEVGVESALGQGARFWLELEGC